MKRIVITVLLLLPSSPLLAQQFNSDIPLSITQCGAMNCNPLYSISPPSGKSPLLSIEFSSPRLKIESWDAFKCEPGKVPTIRLLRDEDKITIDCEPNKVRAR